MFGLVARLLGGMITPLIDQVSASSARLLRKLALFLVAGLALVVVIIALTMAFELWVASRAGHIAGALAVAGLYLAVAVVCVVMAVRGGKPSKAARPATGSRADANRADAATSAAAEGLNAQVDAFAAPLLAMLQKLGLRREQLAVLAGTSLAKQIGPVPLVGLAIVAGFLVGRLGGGLRGLLSSDLVASLLSLDLMSLFVKPGRDDGVDDQPATDA